MRFRSSKRIFSWFLCSILLVSIAFTTVGCGTNNPNAESQPVTEAQESKKTNVLGDGQTKFLFTVIDKDGKETNFEIHTDKKTVGEALFEVDLIDGEEGAYGLYVKTVNGITADYDVDQTYWAFYINGAYATTSADTTTIEEGASYTFKVEKE